jgi:GxxExxY protein
MREINDITGAIVDAAYHIHTRLGPGLLESVYEAILAHTLEQRGFQVERQKPIQLEFDGLRFKEAFRADLLVNGMVLVELKSVETLNVATSKQVLTYLRILGLPVGLVLNFGAPRMHDGVKRILNAQVAPPRHQFNV